MKLYICLMFLLVTKSLCGEVINIGGDYNVSSINRLENGLIEIHFSSVKQSGKYDELTLVSKHIHMGIRLGQALRISAEVVSELTNGRFAINQVLVYLPTSQGKTPVWIVAEGSNSGRLSGIPLLKMHAPSSDYLIL